MGKFVKRQNAIGWDWYLETDEESSWVSHMVKEYIERLEAENATLRKLALDVHALHWSGLDCTECPWIDECDTDGGCPWLGIMADHMRALGIEVPR